MNQKNVKIAYQNSKMTHESITGERLVLGQREIQTLKLLAAEIGCESSPKNMLLDLGCADRFLEPACKSERWTYRGLDYTDVNFEVDTFPVEDNSVDFAVSLAVIEHLRDPESFISEVYRCLKPGGGGLPFRTELPAGLEELLQRPNPRTPLHTRITGAIAQAVRVFFGCQFSRASLQRYRLVSRQESLLKSLLSFAFSQRHRLGSATVLEGACKISVRTRPKTYAMSAVD